ncbi:hypothetical protein PPACK8108_LOCUS9441 [Phakopsora pachyrhizi]|uniref:Uncharacterized protein n=1 Tax=Phakopsora pachyrhizi TaxID=170000 RepID=A0AAV0AYY7_PHAPC|nr:hypothetical protein PPACK8108_LOCUS9441 [Phakopsora pachyrhizi]
MPLNWITGSRVTLGNGNYNSSDDHFKSKIGLDTVGEMNWDKCLLLLVEGPEDCEREMEKELSVIPEPLVEISGEDEEVEGVEKDEKVEEDDREDDDNECANLLVTDENLLLMTMSRVVGEMPIYFQNQICLESVTVSEIQR